MEKILTIKDIAAACRGAIEGNTAEMTVSDIVTDSRKITEGCIFIALRGERFDGHDFVEETLSKGAVCAVVDRDFENNKNLSIIRVESTFHALGDIAACYRKCFSIPSVAITGSVGKTSTKDMIFSVLDEKYNVLKTEGNFNNEIGLPLTIFRLGKENEMAVFEMGMSAFGEISRLTKMAKPHTAVITNIGFSHIEHLGSQENILKAKLEILEGMEEGKGTVILNGDDPFLWGAKSTLPFEILTYGIENENCTVRAINIKTSSEGTEFDVVMGDETFSARVNVPGIHHVYNALSAVLVGNTYNISTKEIVEGIGKFRPQGMRQSAETVGNYVLVKDCYNASPTSMKSGLEVLAVTKPDDENRPSRKVAVLGDMLELGNFSQEAHTMVGALVPEYGADILIAVGPNGKCVKEGAVNGGFDLQRIFVFENNDEAKKEIMNILLPNDVVLFKGSRGMHLEELADFIKEMSAR